MNGYEKTSPPSQILGRISLTGNLNGFSTDISGFAPKSPEKSASEPDVRAPEKVVAPNAKAVIDDVEETGVDDDDDDDDGWDVVDDYSSGDLVDIPDELLVSKP